MALYPNSVINGLKTVADTYGVLNEAQLVLMNLLDPQWKNAFEVLLYPQAFDFTNLASWAMAAIDTVVARLHVMHLSFPHIEFEYADVNGMKHVVGIKHPEEITMSFVENDLGLVRNYLAYWYNQIAKPMSLLDVTGLQGQTLTRAFFQGASIDPALSFSYVFKDKQQASKRNMKFIPQMGTGIPSTAWLQVEGLKLKGIDNWEMGHDAGDEPLIITATFSVDVVRIMALANLL